MQRLLTLQGTMKPDQIISLMTFAGADNTLALADHYDHIHVGWRPLYGTNSKAAKQVNAVLKPKQWIKLIDRLEQIDNPTVALQPSKYALKVTERASQAHPRRVEGERPRAAASPSRSGSSPGGSARRRAATWSAATPGTTPRHVVVIGELEAPRSGGGCARRRARPAAPGAERWTRSTSRARR